MNIAIVAPSPVPLMIGGAENLWWGLLEHLNRRTPHNADLIKLPSPERNFWEVVDSYRRWSALDVSGYDLVISSKYPAWMVQHPHHVCYMLHPLRGLYDTYPAEWTTEFDSDHPDVRGLLTLLDSPGRGRDLIPELFGRLDTIRKREDVPAETFHFPAPLIRKIVHFLDDIGLRDGAVIRHVALAQTIVERPGYYDDPGAVSVAHAPPPLQCHRRSGGRYLFTASRLDAPKRIDLLIRAMQHVSSHIELRISGSGPHEPVLRELALGDDRIRFLGRLNDDELANAYAGARAVLFAPDREDYGYITLEAMLSGKAVVTTTDSGGPTEFIEDGVNGFVVTPDPAPIGARAQLLARHPLMARRMGRAAYARARTVSWDDVVVKLLDGLDGYSSAPSS